MHYPRGKIQIADSRSSRFEGEWRCGILLYQQASASEPEALIVEPAFYVVVTEWAWFTPYSSPKGTLVHTATHSVFARQSSSSTN
jgi:hypothetical protein